MQRKRKSILIATVVAAVAAVAAVVILRDPQTEREVVDESLPVTIGTYTGITSALVYIATDKKYFAEAGLAVELKEYASGKRATDDLLAGKVDVSTATDFVLSSNYFQKTDLRALATISKFDKKHVVGRRSRGIQAIGDLRGKTVGVTKGSSAEFFLGNLLPFGGLGINDINMVDLAPAELEAAMAAGEIDAVATWDPVAYRIKQALGDEAVDLRQDVSTPFYFLLLAKNDWAESQPETVRRLLHALIRAEAFVTSDPGAAKSLIAERLKPDNDSFQYDWSRHEFRVGLPQALVIMLESQVEWLAKLKETAAPANVLDLLHASGIEAVDPERMALYR